MMTNNSIKVSALLCCLMLAGKSTAQVVDADSIEARKLLERISSTKIPMSHPLIAQMALKIKAGDRLGAAEIATTHPEFLNTTVKQMALKKSTREETIRLPLNDFAAVYIGVTRDNLDARQLLMGNFYYAADPAKIPMGVTVRSAMVADLLTSNNHFQDLEKREIDIGAVLMRVDGQKLTTNDDVVVNNPEPAGVLTLRSFMSSHAVAGTNRRLVEYAFREFMCVPMEEMADTGVTDARIGRDIDRFPGGDHLKFQTTCKGCHTQMDSFRGAFAFWDHNAGKGNIMNSQVTPGGNFEGNGVVRKLNVNATVFPSGYQYRDNTFFNNSRGPANASLFGWRGDIATEKRGTTAFATQIANSSRFSQCMVKRIFDSVCRTNLNPKTEITFLKERAVAFEQSGYNIKKMYQTLSILTACQAE